MEFLTVNGASVDIKQALQWQQIAGNTDFTDNTITSAAVVQYAAENGLKASTKEMQEFVNEMRYVLTLESADDFKGWMKENGLDPGSVQNFAEIGVRGPGFRSWRA